MRGPGRHCGLAPARSPAPAACMSDGQSTSSPTDVVPAPRRHIVHHSPHTGHGSFHGAAPVSGRPSERSASSGTSFETDQNPPNHLYGSSAAPIRPRPALLQGAPSDAATPQRPEVVEQNDQSPSFRSGYRTVSFSPAAGRMSAASPDTGGSRAATGSDCAAGLRRILRPTFAHASVKRSRCPVHPGVTSAWQAVPYGAATLSIHPEALP